LILFFVGLALLVGATVRLSLGRDDALGICLAWTFAVTGILFLVQFLAAARLAFDRSRVQLALDLLLTLLFFLVVVCYYDYRIHKLLKAPLLRPLPALPSSWQHKKSEGGF
jgi:hypothetical protein